MQFLQRQNKSNPADLHPFEGTDSAQAQLYFNRNTNDYSDLTGIKYVQPPLKHYESSHSFLQNQIANKAKTSLAQKTKQEFSAQRFQLVQDMINANIDFRIITKLKNELFDLGMKTGTLQNNDLMPIDDFL